MKRSLMRRQVLKIVSGMVLSPWPQLSASTSGFQQTVAALLTATDEGSILQIDLEDLCDTLNLCGSFPLSFTATSHDADKVFDACRNALACIPSHRVKAAVVVCSGNGRDFGLHKCSEVFGAVRNATDESTSLVFGVAYNPMLVGAMSVTWLAGTPDD